jgi:hypothetical protein
MFTRQPGGGWRKALGAQTVTVNIQKLGLLPRAASMMVAALLVSGCDTTKVTYSPTEHMVSILTHHSRLPLGPCNHSYDDAYDILLAAGHDRCDAAQLEMYAGGRLTITSGYLSLDRARSRVTINVTLLGFDQRDYSEGPQPFFYNGRYRYVESDAASGSVRRAFLQDLYRTNKPSLYYHH